MVALAVPPWAHISRRTLFIILALWFASFLLLAHELGAISYFTRHHGPWKPPEIDPVIHGVHASDALNAEPPYPLDPFPSTPMTAPPSGNETHAPWLAAVICAPWEAGRRMMIRASWMSLYDDVPFDGRFVIANPGPAWTEMIRMENRTFGDMIVLDTIPEDDFTANSIKTLVFYDWLLNQSPKKYQYVSKMDTDLWLNARGFWDRFLLPRLEGTGSHLRATVNRTIFGQLYYSRTHRVVYPHGSMYTVTWDMVELLSRLQHEHQVIAGEDMAVAVLMLKGQEKATVVNFKGSERFDFDDRDTRPGEDTAWAQASTRPAAAEHALYGDDVIAVHQLKSDELWLKVAACFDDQGIKKMPPEDSDADSEGAGESKPKKKMKYNKSQYNAIPDYFWEFEDGAWLCNGIWKLEPNTNRDPDI